MACIPIRKGFSLLVEMLLEGVVVVSRELLDPRGAVGREPMASGRRAGFSEAAGCASVESFGSTWCCLAWLFC
ncbi:MAG: hypothetical protein F4226_05840 [Synechococcus sp. SB0678_bin_12]|nr:hypothetical protein [Synechococcus sp. SB0664_bin_36]MYF36310.1 hypothetical protein [Synechococcus sp. SB0678_bin_12]MYI87137.1 hypothetical protein [Synechococcus sp. SB0672_bin_10]MYK07294.1 hypothetical protein [Synechococcus sp. SB0670_bin_20]